MDNRNLILAIVLSVAILLGFELLFPKTPDPATGDQTAQQTQAADPAVPSTTDAPDAAQMPAGDPADAAAPTVGGDAANQPVRDVRELIATGERISITSPSVTGSIALKGGRIDDLILNGYNETLDDQSAKIRLLYPHGSEKAYFAQYGWLADNAGMDLPGADTPWQADSTVLSPSQPVTLSWTNAQGLTFERTIAIDNDFMFTVTQRVVNNSGADVTLNPYALVTRRTTPEVSGLYILHEGPLGVFDGTLQEVDYDELQDERKMAQSTTGGWLGFTDKYWLTALVPDQDRPVNTIMRYRIDEQGADVYQTDFVGGAVTVPAGADMESTSRLFAGAKRVTLLDSYQEQLGITNFDKSVDFGWFYFLTKPIFYALHWLHGLVGNFGVSIVLLTFGIKLVLFPLANKSYVAMSKMKKLQPEMKKLQERFKDDKARLNQEMMALYKREKANPAAGCLPILVQIPIFFSLYKVLLVTIEMRHAPFFGWVQDLSAPDPLSIWTLFGLIPWDHADFVPQFVDIGVWPIIMGFTMWLQQRLNPQPADPVQAKVFMYLPFIFTFLLAQFAAGLVIYWAVNNTLSILQQWVIMRRMGVKVGG